MHKGEPNSGMEMQKQDETQSVLSLLIQVMVRKTYATQRAELRGHILGGHGSFGNYGVHYPIVKELLQSKKYTNYPGIQCSLIRGADIPGSGKLAFHAT